MNASRHEARKSVEILLGCRLGTTGTCCLLALSLAHDVDDFWHHTRRFFADVTRLSGMSLGMSLDKGSLVVLRQEPANLTTGELPDWLTGAIAGAAVT